jgi:hypothetical protein
VKAKSKPQQRTGMGAFILDLVWIVAIVLGVQSFLVQPFSIPSGSMLPGLLVGDRVVAGELNERARVASHVAGTWKDVITSAVYGTLGYEPDAPKGRLVLRPQIEPEWSRLHIENVHMGDALIALKYARAEDGMQFEIVQVAGAYPVRLIFEPILSVPVLKAFVDDAPASLDFKPHGDRIIIPVQIMLDDRRIVRFE